MRVSKKVLVEIGHPAHVHFFSRCIRQLENEGHQVYVVTRNKEITNRLLDEERIPYRCLSSPKSGKLGLLFELLSRWFHIIDLILRERIDLAVSISGISTSFPAWFTGIKSLTFTDTEDANITNVVAFPFSTKVITPRFFLRDLGKKHVRYDGLHELAYLQEFDRNEYAQSRKRMGLTTPYSIVRLVSNEALHDHDTEHLDVSSLERLISRLSEKGKVFVSSQNPLPQSLRKYELDIPVTQIHAVLEGAQIFIGDSPTMAVESAVLGTPAYLVSSRIHRLGNMVHLQKDHQLLNCFLTWEEFWTEFNRLPNLGALKEDWRGRAERFSSGCPPVSEFVTQSILHS